MKNMRKSNDEDEEDLKKMGIRNWHAVARGWEE
jgi:hypothetical protein